MVVLCFLKFSCEFGFDQQRLSTTFSKAIIPGNGIVAILFGNICSCFSFWCCYIFPCYLYDHHTVYLGLKITVTPFRQQRLTQQLLLVIFKLLGLLSSSDLIHLCREVYHMLISWLLKSLFKEVADRKEQSGVRGRGSCRVRVQGWGRGPWSSTGLGLGSRSKVRLGQGP